MLNVFRMLVQPSSGACDLFVVLFHVLCCSGSMCVGVTVWFGLGVVVSLCRPNHTLTSTHIEPEQHNPWNNKTNSRKLLKMDVLTFETLWALNNEIIKQVTSSWSIFIQEFVRLSWSFSKIILAVFDCYYLFTMLKSILSFCSLYVANVL